MEDYRSKSLSLRRHPLAFLRADLIQRRMVPCAELRRARDGRRVTVAGLVLVRQKPSSDDVGPRTETDDAERRTDGELSRRQAICLPDLRER